MTELFRGLHLPGGANGDDGRRQDGGWIPVVTGGEHRREAASFLGVQVKRKGEAVWRKRRLR